MKTLLFSLLTLFQGELAPSSSNLLTQWKLAFGDSNFNQVTTTIPKSLVFLVPIASKTGGLEEFYKNFAKPPIGFGYDVIFISDYFGLKSQGDDVVLNFLNKTLTNAAKFEQETGIKANLILDINGFRLATNKTIRDLAEQNKYIFGYFSCDEPDAHPVDKDHFALSPDQVENIIKGTLNLQYNKPLFINFENQFGAPSARQHNYVKNTDALYLDYISRLDKYHTGPNYISVDFYLFNRSVNPPTNQLFIYNMMQYATLLTWRGNAKNFVFAWTEPTLQGLGYICDWPDSKVRPATPTELKAQIWLYWVGGQTGMRGDFNYIFRHLCSQTSGWNHEGLLHPYYVEHRKVVERANERQRELSKFLDQKAIWFLTTNDLVKCSLRFYIDPSNQLQVLIMVVNIGNQDVGQVGIVTHPVLNLLGSLKDLESTDTIKFDPNGFAIDKFGAYQVKLYKL